MRLRIQLLRLSLAASLSLAATTWAQERTAEDFFHGGALHYLSNNVPAALQVVTNGLQAYPGDEKLKKLYELLNQQQQQQQQQQNQQDQKDQKQDQQKDQKQDQQKKDEQKQQDQQQSKNDQQQKEEQKKQDEQKKRDQQKSGGDKSKDQKDEKGQEAQPMEAHAMTPQEAKQLLDAQKGDEQVLIFQPQAEPKNRTKQLKDW